MGVVVSRVRQARRGALLDVVEDLANDIGVGDIGNDPQPPTAMRAERDVELEDPFSR
jgi:hypothetical protein